MMLGMFWVALLGIWLILTIVNQFNFPWVHRLRRLDVLSVIPRWTFFAPNPVVTDVRLCYRTADADGTESDWEEIDLIGGRTLVSAVWNPHKRTTKAISDMVSFLRPLCGDGLSDPASIQILVPYRCLQNHVIRTADRSGRRYKFCQFFVAETTGFQDVAPEQFLFRSNLVRLGSES